MFTPTIYKDEEDIRNLRTDAIDKFHIYIDYLGFRNVILDVRNGYVNATKLCKEDNKRFDNWLANQRSKDIIDELYFQLNGRYQDPSTGNQGDENQDPSPDDENRSARNPADGIQSAICTPTTTLTGGSNPELRGTYVHPLLLPNILSWLSPKFALRVGKIVNMYAIKEKQDKIFSLETMIKENREEYARAEKRHQELKENHQQLLERHEVTISMLEDAETSRDRAHGKIDRLTKGIENLSVKQLDSKLYCLPPLKRSLEEILVISTIHLILGDTKKRIIIVNRCQRRCFKQTRNNVIKRLLVKDENKGYARQDPFIVPHCILESSNVTRLWASFKYENEGKFTVENSVITIHQKGFRVVTELIKYAGVEPKPLDQLQREYDELLNMNDEEVNEKF